MNDNLIKRLREYSSARKGEIAELTREAADALERQKGTLEEEYMKHYIQGRKDERALQDALKRPRGEWIPLFPVLCDRPYCYECSNCGSLSGRMTNFCQNCGADMRQGGDA